MCVPPNVICCVVVGFFHSRKDRICGRSLCPRRTHRTPKCERWWADLVDIFLEAFGAGMILAVTLRKLKFTVSFMELRFSVNLTELLFVSLMEKKFTVSVMENEIYFKLHGNKIYCRIYRTEIYL